MRSRTALRRWPGRNFLAELDQADREVLDIDELAHRDKRLQRLLRSFHAAGEVVRRRVGTDEWIALSDACSALRTTEFETAFNLGFENGLFKGRADSAVRRSRGPDGKATAALRLDLRRLVATSSVAAEDLVAVLLEHASALMRSP